MIAPSVHANQSPQIPIPTTVGWVHPLVIVLYALLTGVMTWPLAANLTTAIPGDSFDGWQNYWNLWWIKVALVERVQHPFFTDLLYAPTGVGLYFHTLNPFNGLVTLPIQLSSGLIPAYNSVVWISWVLGGYGVFLLALWVLKRVLGIGYCHPIPNTQYPISFLAGVIFTFSPFHMAHLLGHMQVMSLQWMPFYILYLLRGTAHVRAGLPWRRDGWMAGLFLALVGLCDWYFVLYLFLFTAFFLFWQWGAEIRHWITRRKSGRGAARTLMMTILPALTAGIVFVVLLSPILAPMVREAIRFDFMERPASDLYILSATLADFLIPNRLHTLFRPESFMWVGNQIAPVSERTIAIGYLPLILALAAAWLDRRRSGFWLVGALFFLLIALGPVLNLRTIGWDDIPTGEQPPGWTPYELLNRTIPFMRISRSVSRFAVMVQLAMAVTAAIGLHALLRRRSPRLRRSLAVVAVLVVLAEFWVAPYPLSPPDTPYYYAQIAEESGGSLLNLPMNYDRPGYLLYQTVHHKPLTVAYISRDDPRTYTERMPVLQHFRHLGSDILEVDPVRVGNTVLHDLGITWVVLDRYKMPGGLERSYTTDLAQGIFAGQAPIYEDERITVYRVSAPAAPQAYPLLGPTGWGPLVREENGGGRRIGNEGAILQLRHLPPAASIAIRYGTAGDLPLQILAQDGRTTTLPPAPNGHTAVLGLNVSGDLTEVVFSTADPAGAMIEAIRLVTP
ncbi:MAG: hypothetical protein KF893_07580 [Caldilineaceae bacterium]|nr:hypothetical protein [Caldilineaceae bacterium]